MKQVALQTVPLESSNRLLSRFFSFFLSSNKTLQQQKNNIPNIKQNKKPCGFAVRAN
jgi:hypothetical protein